MASKLIQHANTKLGSNTMMFNIPASKAVCGRICDKCYAHKSYRIYPNVLPAQERRLEAAKRPEFVTTINKELSRTRKKPTYFRIHGSAGEFFSQEYIKKWEQIVKSNPYIIFYAYTKRMSEFNFTALSRLKNMVLIDSLMFGRLNYGHKEDAPEGTYVCPAVKGTKDVCGNTCTWCMQKGQADKQGVYFLRH